MGTGIGLEEMCRDAWNWQKKIQKDTIDMGASFIKTRFKRAWEY